ncbi:hypothetical protein CPB83DRAFT_50863 [Crepidotus variabilis]|uniref:DUF7053 domain-containing protein n=1 Tax=Crepidotus variabilis TaxID=179855 RepID=A0A9P6JTX6_9AGAR|nr:hypothetical protein CPB83DRAFT_50863 [Crepidotus variabilis]
MTTFIQSILPPLFLSSTVHLEKRFPPGPTVADVLAVLHDTQQAIRLSPLIISAEPDTTRPADDGQWFIMTEKLPIFGGIINGKTTFKLKWTNVPEGGDGEVEAAAGTKLKSQQRVKQDGDVVLFKEDLVVKALSIFMPFVKPTMTKAHEELQDILIQKVLDNSKHGIVISLRADS